MNSTLSMHYGATAEIFERAKELRNNLTEAEIVVWNCLCKNQLGVRFRRQHPIAKYIVDFYCHEIKLVVEIDGSVHESEEQKQADMAREMHLQTFGLKIIRFTNKDIMKDYRIVIEQIKNVINETIPPLGG